MDGSSASLIAIPIVVVVVLAAWLILVAYAASHPRWKHGPAAKPAPADGQLRMAEPRRADRALAGADQDAITEKQARRAA